MQELLLSLAGAAPAYPLAAPSTGVISSPKVPSQG